MANVRAILWDLDGVLVDSASFHYEAFRQLFESRGREFTRERFGRLFGLRNHAILRDILGDISDEETSRLANEKEEAFRRLIAGNVRPLPGAECVLRVAIEAGLKQAIVSSTPRANIDLILESLRLRDMFEVIVGEEDASRGKPDPQGFQIAAGRLGVPPESCVVLEDAPEGIEAAHAAGMRTVGLATTRPATMLTSARLVVATLEDPRVLDLLRQA